MSGLTPGRYMLKLLKESSAAKRVVSTSARAEQSATVLNVEGLSLEQQCPLRRTMDSLESLMKAPISNDAVQPQTQEYEPQPFEAIPGPKGLPFFGTIFDYFKKDGLRFDKMFEAYRQRSLEFGPIYKEKFGPITNVVISDPDVYQKVIRSEGKTPIRREMEPMAHYRTQKGIGLGLVNSQGAEWHRYRRVVSKKMLKLKEVTDFCQPMNEVGDDFVARLREASDATSKEVPELEKELFKWAMESIGTFLFEERIGCLSSQPHPEVKSFIDNLQGLFKLMQPLMYNLPIYKVFPTKLWKQYEAYSDNVLECGRYFVDKKVKALQSSMADENGQEKGAFLTYLLSQESLSPEEAAETAVDLMMGAVETTSNATVWCLYSLAKNPEVQEKLHSEINKVLSHNAEITPQKLAQLPYVKAVLKETFRLYPITFATSRILPDKMEVGGFEIPAGTHVQANLFGMFRNPELYSEPEKFQPERWLRGNTDNKQKALSNLIWGHGARMCIGRRFAEQEVHLALAKIVQNFKLEYHHEDLEPVLNTVMTPDRPAKISFVPRQSA
ncbi:cytochrome P450 10-like [Haliotis cracherodii]|uniref:cytochrome P450 10-like n=1 Tax=Haliotis rufescens TaxID=6454 RepID=UPI00201F77DF|nr:cytochrome P450 10-like [Haliotis rufescens]